MYCVVEASQKCTVAIKVEVWSDYLTTAKIYQCGVHHCQPPASFLSACYIQGNLAQTIAQEYGIALSLFLIQPFNILNIIININFFCLVHN
jgi:hypothetical protein